MSSFWRFWTIGYQILTDFLKIWHEGSRHQVLWHISVFVQISKNFEFYKGFPKKTSGFRNFGGQKLKTLTFRDSHFAECVIFHLNCSFCAVCFKTLFLANFLTLSWFWSKLSWSDPTKTSISQKNNFPIDFDQIWSFDVKLM